MTTPCERAEYPNTKEMTVDCLEEGLVKSPPDDSSSFVSRNKILYIVVFTAIWFVSGDAGLRAFTACPC